MSEEIKGYEDYLIKNKNWFDSPYEGAIFIKGEYTFDINDDKITMAYKHYSCKKEPKCLVMLVHGLDDCADLMAPIANSLVQNNYEVLSFDHIG
jgi:alpha-beta hydrolase superfamily lysophospholipase